MSTDEYAENEDAENLIKWDSVNNPPASSKRQVSPKNPPRNGNRTDPDDRQEITVDWNDKGSNSSACGAEFVQRVFYPKDSIIEELFQYGVTQTEGVDAYIVGSILAVSAAQLARRVWFTWGR
jgi:hypothetical protein